MAFDGVEPTDTVSSTSWVSQHYMLADSFSAPTFFGSSRKPSRIPPFRVRIRPSSAASRLPLLREASSAILLDDPPTARNAWQRMVMDCNAKRNLAHFR